MLPITLPSDSRLSSAWKPHILKSLKLRKLDGNFYGSNPDSNCGTEALEKNLFHSVSQHNS